MKPLKLSLLLTFFPLVFFGQSLTGLWMGKMTNDSNTVRKDDEYEIVLTQYKDKVYGYTRNTFFVDEVLYYIVKRVEGQIVGDICEVKDDEILMHNFPQKPEKKVKATYTFKRNTTDSTWNLDGTWKTNLTKKYYSISGKSELKTEKDLSKSKIFPHLEELKKTADIAFYNNWKKENENSVARKDDAFKQEFLKSLVKAEKEKTNRVAAPNTTGPASINTSTINNSNTIAITPDEKKSDIAIEKQEAPDKKELNNNKQPGQINTAAISNPENIAIKTDQRKSDIVAEKQISDDKKKLNNNQPALINIPSTANTDAVAIKPTAKKSDIVSGKQTGSPTTTPQQNKNIVTAPVNSKPVAVPVQQPSTGDKKLNATVNNNNTEINKPVQPDKTITTTATQEEKIKQSTAPVVKTNIPVLNTDAAKEITEREFDKPSVVEFSSDSLVLVLYDNGEVDGDTVSVLLNGEVIIPKQCLKTVAFKKTIYIAPEEFQVNIVLYAENLGTYPPNTGLLVIYDGEERHNVRFSADFKKNSAIILKRKR